METTKMPSPWALSTAALTSANPFWWGSQPADMDRTLIFLPSGSPALTSRIRSMACAR
jgi:hypothetical protein